MGTDCSCTMNDQIQTDTNDLINQPYLKRSNEDIENFKKKITVCDEKLTDLCISEEFKKIIKDYGEEIDDCSNINVWKLTQEKQILYLWIVNQKESNSKLSPIDLLENQIKVIFVHNSSQQQQKNNNVFAYFHGHTKYGFANTTQGFHLHGNGCVYEGTIRNSQANGWGKYQNLNNKYLYEGYWKKDVPEGNGKQTLGKYFYQGNFVRGKKEGQGTFEGPNMKYEGNFVNNKFHGKGKLQTDTFIYTGQFKEGKKDGAGQWQAKKSKQTYKGSFKDDKKNGEGIFDFGNEYKYIGSFIQDKMQGNGIILQNEKQVHSGLWINGINFL